MNRWSEDRNKVVWSLILVFPIGIYLMWKGKHFSRELRWFLTSLLFVFSFFVTKGLHEWYLSETTHCSSTLMVNGCVVQLDEYCRVINQSCDE